MASANACQLADEGDCSTSCDRLRRGMCSKHYQAFLDARDIARPQCILDGCTEPRRTRSLCAPHYDEMKRAHRLDEFPRAPLGMDRFWSLVEKTPTCWLWHGRTNESGYGWFWSKAVGCRLAVVHRVAYEEIRGPIPRGLVLDHICRVRHCVNPDHLEPVTGKENTLRGISFAAINARKTHCKHGHEFTPENIIRRPGNGRECRACRADIGRRRNDRRRAATKARQVAAEAAAREVVASKRATVSTVFRAEVES